MLKFANARMPVEEFEEWLYNDLHLESAIGSDRYLELISLNFRDGRTVESAKEKVAAILEDHHPGLLPRDRVRELLQQMLDGTCPLVVGLRRLSTWYWHGYDFIPEHFVGYESETDTVPEPSQYDLWAREALAKQLERLSWYEKDIRQACHEFLAQLEREAEPVAPADALKDARG